jgi:hypothetical protein
MDEITARHGAATSLGMPAFPDITGRVTNPPAHPPQTDKPQTTPYHDKF